MGMHIGHVAIRTADLQATADYVRRALGLATTVQTDDEVLLTANEKHHELQLISGEAAAFDHVGLEVENERELRAVVERALEHGASLVDSEPEPGLGATQRFVGPAGMLYEVYEGMSRAPLTADAALRPLIRRLGHLTFMCAAHDEVLAFWLDGLGFRISDQFGAATWTRCDVDHHGLAVMPRAAGNVLHHHAWEVQDIAALARHCDDTATRGLTQIWGPVRHGPGFNFATYMPDGDGGVIEVYSDLLRIDVESSYVPVDWSQRPHALNLWGPQPTADLESAGLPIRTTEA